MLKKILAAVAILASSVTVQASIVGSWYFYEAPGEPGEDAAGGPVVLTFLSNGQYLMGQDGSSAANPSGQDGMEWGTYDFDGSSLSWNTLLDTNGEWGLNSSDPLPGEGSQAVTVNGDILSIDGRYLQRVNSLSIIGGWVSDGPENDETVTITFIDSNNFMLVHGNSDDDCNCGQAGIEYGSYSWDIFTGQIEFSIVTDTNGEFGVSHGLSSAMVSGNTLTLGGDEGEYTLSRVTPSIIISPPTGTYYSTQDFHLVVYVKYDMNMFTTGSILYNDTEVAGYLGSCWKQGTADSGGSTYRCPLSGRDLAEGVNVLSVELTFSDETVLRESVTWTVEHVHE